MYQLKYGIEIISWHDLIKVERSPKTCASTFDALIFFHSLSQCPQLHLYVAESFDINMQSQIVSSASKTVCSLSSSSSSLPSGASSELLLSSIFENIFLCKHHIQHNSLVALSLSLYPFTLCSLNHVSIHFHPVSGQNHRDQLWCTIKWDYFVHMG